MRETKKISKTICLLGMMLLFTSCEDPLSTVSKTFTKFTNLFSPSNSKKKTGLAGRLNDYLSPPERPCEAIYNNPVVDNENEAGDCVKYNDQAYSGGAAAGLAWMNGIGDTDNKNQNFINYIAPIAVKVQQKTGLPASVIIAQAIQETGWGKSKLFATGNAAFGHSCYSKNSGFVKTVQVQSDPDEFRDIKTKCTYKRPANEGARYLTFDSMEDSIWAYADNLLYNKRTRSYYSDVRKAVGEAREKGEVAPYDKVVKGLGSYATDSSYQKELGSLIKSNKLYSFDNLKLCDSDDAIGLRSVNQCDPVVDSSSRGSKEVIETEIVTTEEGDGNSSVEAGK